MPDEKISQLPRTTTAGRDDLLIIDQGGVTKAITYRDFLRSFGVVLEGDPPLPST